MFRFYAVPHGSCGMEILKQPLVKMERKQDFFEPEVNGLPFTDDIQCLVFRTSLQNQKDVEKISAILDNLAGISDWHVDLGDWEKVLRIECTGLTSEYIIKTLFSEGVIAESMLTDKFAK